MKRHLEGTKRSNVTILSYVDLRVKKGQQCCNKYSVSLNSFESIRYRYLGRT